MVHFGRKLAALVYEPWRDYYLSYDQLKRILEQETTKQDEAHAANPSEDLKFVRALDEEIEKCVLFFLQEQGQLASACALLKDDEHHCAELVRKWRQSLAKRADLDDGEAGSLDEAGIRAKLRDLCES